MATAVLDLVADNSASTDIVIAVTQNPGIVLLDSEKFDAFYTKMKAETDKLVADVTTQKGRDEIRSMAARVVKAKTGIDKARLTLTKEWRDNTKRANEAGSVIEDRLSGLAAEVRRPLTEWEAAEEARQVRVEGAICEIRELGTVLVEDTAAAVRARGMQVFELAFDPNEFGDRLGEAESAKAVAIDTLKTALVRLTKEEADRAELEKLRAEKIEAERIAAEQAAAAEADRQRIEAERIAEERRVAAEQAEADRIENVRKEAAAQAQRDAEAAAQAERDKVQAAHDAEIAAERAKVVEADRLRQVEADRIAQIEREREAALAAERAEQQRLAEEQAKREANQAHRTRVKTAAKQAIMTCGADEETAQKIVLAMIAGEIPAVALRF